MAIVAFGWISMQFKDILTYLPLNWTKLSDSAIRLQTEVLEARKQEADRVIGDIHHSKSH